MLGTFVLKTCLSFWIISRRREKNSVATRNARLAAIHEFARFLATRDPEQVEESQRLLAVPIKRGPARTVDYLGGNEISAMLDAVTRERSTTLGPRFLGVSASIAPCFRCLFQVVR